MNFNYINYLKGTYKKYEIEDLDKLIEVLVTLSEEEDWCVRLNIDDSLEADGVSCVRDKEKYLLTYFTEDLDNPNEKYPRSYCRGIKNPKKIEISGNYYDENMVCYDFGFVLMVFKEFFEKKEIPLYILS